MIQYQLESPPVLTVHGCGGWDRGHAACTPFALPTIQSKGLDGETRIHQSKFQKQKKQKASLQAAATAMGRYSVVVSASVHVVFLACSVTVSKSTEGKHEGPGGYDSSDSAGAPFGVEVWKPDAHAVQTFPSSQPQGLLLTGQRLLVSQHFSTSTIGGLTAQPGRWGWWWCGFVVAVLLPLQLGPSHAVRSCPIQGHAGLRVRALQCTCSSGSSSREPIASRPRWLAWWSLAPSRGRRSHDSKSGTLCHTTLPTCHLQCPLRG